MTGTGARTGRLSGKVALVTGATQAMGEAIAARLASEGAVVLGVGRNVDRGEAGAPRVRAAGRRAKFVAPAISREDEVARAVAEAARRFGALDIVVNNAASLDGKEAAPHLLATETFDTIVKVGLYAPFWLAQHAAPLMIS